MESNARKIFDPALILHENLILTYIQQNDLYIKNQQKRTTSPDLQQ